MAEAKRARVKSAGVNIAGAKTTGVNNHGVKIPGVDTEDWCHFAARIERTAEHRRLKRGVLGHEDEKYSYLVASRIPATWPRARIVRHPFFRPGHVQFTLCTADGLKQETVGKSDAERYRQARKAEWGDAWE